MEEQKYNENGQNIFIEEHLKRKEKKKKNLISCTKMSKFYLFPFITPIFITIRDIMINRIIENNNKNEDLSLYFFYAICISTFLTLGGIIFFILDFKSFREKQKTKLMLKADIKRKSELKEENKLHIVLILILMSISFAIYISTVLLSLYHTTIEKRQYTIFLIVFLSKFILKKEIYRHQKFSLVLALLGFLLLTIVKLLKIKVDDFPSNILSFIGTIFYAIHYVYLQYLQNEHDIPIYFCYMIVGISSLLFSFIGFPIISKIAYGDGNVFKRVTSFFKDDFQKKYYINLVIFIIAGIATETFVAFTIFYFSIMHFVLSSFISPILHFIYNNCVKEEKDTAIAIILSIIGYIIELFSILIYNEIIVLNIYDLNRYTVKGINDRAQLEWQLTEENESNIKKNKKSKNKYEIDDNYLIEYDDDNDNDSEEEKNIELKNIK